MRLTNDTAAADLPATIGNLLDLPAFVRFVVAQNFLAETDGFLGKFGLNNFYLYRLENQNLHTLIMWDADNTFYSAELPTNDWGEGTTLMQKLMSLPEYGALYQTEMARNVELAEADGWLDTEIIRQLQRIDTAMKEDPAKPYSVASYEGAAGTMLSFAQARIAFVKCEFERGAGNISCRTP